MYCTFIHSQGLTQDAGLAQAGDGLSVVPAGQNGGRARAGDALRVRCWLFDRVQVRRPDLIIGRGVASATPGKQHTSHKLTTCAWMSNAYTIYMMVFIFYTSVSELVQCCCNVSGWAAPVCRPEITTTHQGLSLSITNKLQNLQPNQSFPFKSTTGVFRKKRGKSIDLLSWLRGRRASVMAGVFTEDWPQGLWGGRHWRACCRWWWAGCGPGGSCCLGGSPSEPGTLPEENPCRRSSPPAWKIQY